VHTAYAIRWPLFGPDSTYTIKTSEVFLTGQT
jgi:hypothetical protein